MLGAAYYPEHWPESRWPEDARLLSEAGINVVRMMEFAWDKLEPRDGEYDFAWMDRAIGIFQDAGIKVVLCTPTAAPPPWLTQAHPEILFVDVYTGRQSAPSTRRHATCHAPAYVEYSDRIVRAVAEHWGDHPNVMGWQIDNEFGCHGSTRDASNFAKTAFQGWLKEKYGTLDALNAAWGTQFWSSTYTDWAQIPVPLPSTASHNPGLVLDYFRFSSDGWIGYQRRQVEILRQHIGPERFITHNFMLKFSDIDYFALARDLDLVGFDNYLYGMNGPVEVSLNLDLMRGMKRRPFWVMEQQAGTINWTPYNPPVPPGAVRTWTHMDFVHGAEAVVYFRERAVNIGQEQYHSGLLKHDGTPDRGWHEAKQVSEDIQAMPHLMRPQAPVAILFSYEDQWALQLDPHNREFSYYALVLDIYRQLWEQHIPVDVLPRDADLTGYEAVILPSPVLIDEGQVANWRKYVEAGGKLVVTFRAFFKNQGNTWTDQPMPAGGMADLVGATVDEFLSIPPVPMVGLRGPGDPMPDWNDERGANVTDIGHKPVGMGFGEGFGVAPKQHYRLWAEILAPSTATPILRYADGYYKDAVAGTVNKVGAGEVYYIGCWSDTFLPRSVWQGLGLQQHAIAERDLPRNAVFEVVKMHDEAGNVVEVRLNHSKRTVSWTKAEAKTPETSS